ncbi:MAG: hypothetical protein HRF47_16420 [Chloroflexota bacterium]
MLNKTPLRTHPSLLPLRAALTFAESGTPARPRRMDADERRAMQLIARMQARYKKVQPFVAQRDPFRKRQGRAA